MQSPVVLNSLLDPPSVTPDAVIIKARTHRRRLHGRFAYRQTPANLADSSAFVCPNAPIGYALMSLPFRRAGMPEPRPPHKTTGLMTEAPAG